MSEPQKVLWKSALTKDFINKIQTSKESDVEVDDELYCKQPSKIQKLDVNSVPDEISIPLDELLTKINETNSKYFQKSENETLRENRAEILSSILSNQGGSADNATVTTTLHSHEVKPVSTYSKTPSTAAKESSTTTVIAVPTGKPDKFSYSGSSFGLNSTSSSSSSSLRSAYGNSVQSIYSIPCSPLSSWYLSDGKLYCSLISTHSL